MPSWSHAVHTVFRVTLLPLGILFCLLLVQSALGQCPPVPEGSLPPAGQILRYNRLTNNANGPPAHLFAEVQVPVDPASRTRVIADAAVVDSDAGPAPARRPSRDRDLAGKEVR